MSYKTPLAGRRNDAYATKETKLNVDLKTSLLVHNELFTSRDRTISKYEADMSKTSIL